MSIDKPFSKLEEPCDDCDKEESAIPRDGKVLLRFIRAKKKPQGAMQNYKDGQTYWMYARHAKLPWWELVDKVDYPIVSPATDEDSVYEAIGDLDDMEKPAFLGESGITIKPGVGPVGGFIEPSTTKRVSPQPVVEDPPTLKWKNQELVDYIADRGGVAYPGMKKKWLLEIALNLTDSRKI